MNWNDRLRLLFCGVQGKAWLVCVCTLLTSTSIFGTMLSFGAWFLKLEQEFGTNSTVIGWIGSVAYGLLCLASPLSTPLFLRFGHRKVSLCGVVLCSASLLTTSFVPHIAYMFFTYSLLYGLGANFVFNASINLVGAHFQHRHRSLACCLASTGFAFGTLVMNPVTEAILSAVGLRNTYRILAAVILVKGVLCCCAFVAPPDGNSDTASDDSHDRHDETRTLAKPCDKDDIAATEKLMEQTDTSKGETSSETNSTSTKEGKEKKTSHLQSVFRRKVWTNPGFLLWIFANVVLCLSLLFPFFHLIKYMTTLGIPENRGVIVASVAGFAELAGRLLCGVLGDILPFPKAYLFPAAALVMAVDTFSCLLITTFTGMIIYALVIGLCTAIITCLVYVVNSELFGLENVDSTWPFSIGSQGLGGVIGPTIAGAIYDRTGAYSTLFYVGGGLLSLSSALLLAAILLRNAMPLTEGTSSDSGHLTQNIVLGEDRHHTFQITEKVTTV
ncbi:monocarboxylate transporter 7-like isoform X1 [Branchiostoma lanceolatum]|uniref:monocarboxylate transporter 7-like isoform X1 n=1 Tax=Branchiostoma lanceolatum TaxID=7740 RepID=UPI0034552D73